MAAKKKATKRAAKRSAKKLDVADAFIKANPDLVKSCDKKAHGSILDTPGPLHAVERPGGVEFTGRDRYPEMTGACQALLGGHNFLQVAPPVFEPTFICTKCGQFRKIHPG